MKNSLPAMETNSKRDNSARNPRGIPAIRPHRRGIPKPENAAGFITEFMFRLDSIAPFAPFSGWFALEMRRALLVAHWELGMRLSRNQQQRGAKPARRPHPHRVAQLTQELAHSIAAIQARSLRRARRGEMEAYARALRTCRELVQAVMPSAMNWYARVMRNQG